VDAMSEARALLEAALEGTIGVHRRLGVTYADLFAATKEGAELIRRADRPEARVAVGESRTEVVQRMQREGGGPVTAVMVSHAGEVPEFPTTKNGISMLVNAEWHAPQCKVNRTRQYMDCDCSLSRAIAATEQEAIRRADRPDAVAVEMLATALHKANVLVGIVCEHGDDEEHREHARDILANLPAPRPPEPEARVAVERLTCDCPGVFGVHERGIGTCWSAARRPPKPDRTAALVEALDDAIAACSSFRDALATAPDEAP
jgi:hypothetical protein